MVLDSVLVLTDHSKDILYMQKLEYSLSVW